MFQSILKSSIIDPQIPYLISAAGLAISSL
jgi:hypothetical protein